MSHCYGAWAVMCWAQWHAPVLLWGTEAEGGLRFELRADSVCALRGYWEEKGEKWEGKGQAECLYHCPALSTLCIRGGQRAALSTCDKEKEMFLVKESHENLKGPPHTLCLSPWELALSDFKESKPGKKPGLQTSLVWSSTNSFHHCGTAPYVLGGRVSYWVLNYRGEKHLKFLSIYTHNFSKSLYTNPLASAELLTGYGAKK